MAAKGVCSLRILCLASIKKNKIPMDEGPVLLRNVAQNVHYLNSCDLPHPSAEKVLDMLARRHMCVVAGGYAAYKCMYTETYDDIDIFVLLEKDKVSEIMRSVVGALRCDGRVRTVCAPVYQEGPTAKVVKVHTVNQQLYSVRVCDIIFIEVDDSVPSCSGNILSNAYDACNFVVHHFDLDVVKCVGVMIDSFTAGFSQGGMLFFPLSYPTEFVFDSDFHETLRIDACHPSHHCGPFETCKKLEEKAFDEEKQLRKLKVFRNIINREVGDMDDKGKKYEFMEKIRKIIVRWQKYNLRVRYVLRATDDDWASSIAQTKKFLERC